MVVLLFGLVLLLLVGGVQRLVRADQHAEPKEWGVVGRMQKKQFSLTGIEPVT